tara:strand:+ start:6986 stop:7783 length:798 start_codon:yes stop_codon:yes gene_type:complete
MLVSIIIPVFNRSGIILHSINSVISQSYPFWELIIVDDGSTDNTVSILKEISKSDERIMVYLRPKEMPKGANSCRNYGLEMANGELIKWLDSDDLLLDFCLESQVNVFVENPEILLCLGYSKYFNHVDGLLCEDWSRQNFSQNYFSDHLINKIRWNVGGLMWKRSLFKCPPFNNYLKNSQEWLMHSEFLYILDDKHIFNYKAIVCFVRRGNNRMSNSRTTSYYFHQFKARFILLKRFSDFTLNDNFQLVKQCIVYLYYAVISYKN